MTKNKPFVHFQIPPQEVDGLVRSNIWTLEVLLVVPEYGPLNSIVVAVWHHHYSMFYFINL